MGLVQGESMDRRFFHKLGASLLDRTICSSAGAEGLAYTLGGKVGMRVEFFAEAKLILIWGSNSIGSNLHFWRHALAARRADARLVCIDPRKSETADKCDQHIALLPGTDGALAFGLMQQLIVNDWLDHDYIARYTLGWEALRERALQWPPARVAAVCGIPEAQVVELARALTAPPGRQRIRLNYGMQRVRGRRQRHPGGSLPAGAGRRLAAARRRLADEQLRPVPGAARGGAAARPAGRAAAAPRST